MALRCLRRSLRRAKALADAAKSGNRLRGRGVLRSRSNVRVAKDPLVALCDAIIALSTDEARAAAADNADIELVRQVELADQRVNAILVPTAERPLPTATPDAFEALHEVDLDSLGTSTWESP